MTRRTNPNDILDRMYESDLWEQRQKAKAEASIVEIEREDEEEPTLLKMMQSKEQEATKDKESEIDPNSLLAKTREADPEQWADAETLLKQSFVFGEGKLTRDKELKRLGEQGKALSAEYKRKKAEIEQSKDYTETAKGKRLDALYGEYEKKVQAIIKEQGAIDARFHQERKDVAEKLLKEANEKAGIANFSEKDMSYILYVLEHGSDSTILNVLRQYRFNPFLIDLVNIGEEKKPPMERKEIKHPLQVVMEQAYNPLHNRLKVDVAGGNFLDRTLGDLLPTRNVPMRDQWSKYREEESKWGDM